MWRKIKNSWHLLQAFVANAVYGFPSRGLTVLAITGTDGKTTTSTLLYHILKSAGKRVALISTVAAYIDDQEIDTGFHVTNPSPLALQKLLRQIKQKGIEYVVLEITSHGIDQNRNWGIHPHVAGITNVTHEHLDYHKTFDNYLATKARLLLGADQSFINKDAKSSYEPLRRLLVDHKKKFDVYRVSQMDKTVAKTAVKRFGDESYNLQNAALAAAIAAVLGIKNEAIAEGVDSFPGVSGRMEIVAHHRKMEIIVDFAHTPNALEQALKQMRHKMAQTKSRGRLIVVFGCAGLRDIGKRPLMGEIASRLADLAVFTAEDPRTEDIWSILQQMKSGVKINHNRIVSIPDRYGAIAFAINKLGKSGDTIIICGKGHERSMCYGHKELPWSDQEAVRKAIAGKARF